MVAVLSRSCPGKMGLSDVMTTPMHAASGRRAHVSSQAGHTCPLVVKQAAKDAAGPLEAPVKPRIPQGLCQLPQVWLMSTPFAVIPLQHLLAHTVLRLIEATPVFW